MALNVQDPTTPIGNANSYLSLVDARTLAEQYAYTLPVDDTEAETALIKGFRYIELKEPQMCGQRATTEQNSSYPRAGVYIRCNAWPSDQFPIELLLAQVIAAENQSSGVDLSGGVDDGRSIASEQVDVISVSYFQNGKTGSTVTIPEFDSTIEPLMCKSNTGAQFTTYRI
ncbi:head completion adaptor [Vibrio phage 1.240.O._10N.261.52.F8]|nr:head completion adaptor [Vibrio phage 1.240.O._10N.261.52.F8]